MADFACGAANVPQNVEAFTLSGLSIGFVPETVLIQIHQPSSAAPLISGFLTGSATREGFSVALSAPALEAGYVLHWQAFARASGQIGEDSLAISYTVLVETLAHFLGYDKDNLTSAMEEEIDGYIQAGIRNYYYPPKLEGIDENFEWSFLHMKGTITLTAGVASYDLPDGFGRMFGGLNYEANERLRAVAVIPYGEMLHISAGEEAGTPRLAAIAATNRYGEKGQRKEIVFYPVPDAAKTLSFEFDCDAGRISAEKPYPLGGAMYGELIAESCLAVAEQRANDEAGLHTENFNRLLVSTIGRDRKSTAQNYGKIGDWRNIIPW